LFGTVQMAATKTIIRPCAGRWRGRIWPLRDDVHGRASDWVRCCGRSAERLGAVSAGSILGCGCWRGAWLFLFRVVIKLPRPVEATALAHGLGARWAVGQSRRVTIKLSKLVFGLLRLWPLWRFAGHFV